MNGTEPPPLHHLSDWDAWMWVVTLIGAPVLFGIAGVALWYVLTVDLYASELRRPTLAGIIAVAALLAALAISSSVARHIAGPTPDRWWLALPILVAAVYGGVTASSAPGSRRWFGWTMAGIAAAGGVVIAINDALNRIAADIPMGFKALVGLLALGTVALLVYAFGSRQRV